MFFLSFKKIGSKRGQKIRVVADTTRGQSRASVVHSVKEQHRHSLEATMWIAGDAVRTSQSSKAMSDVPRLEGAIARRDRLRPRSRLVATDGPR